MGRLVAYQDFVDPVFKRPVLIGRSNGITGGTKEISSDLPCVWVGEEQEPQPDTDKDLQHDTASCSAMIRRIVESASPVCSLMER